MASSDLTVFDPPQILNAKRVTGMVVVPENDVSDLNANPLDLTWNATAAPDGEPNPASGPPALRRRSSLAGNILLVDHPDGQKAFFLQRKMAKTTYGCLRVGFLCQKRIDEDDTGMEWDVIKSNGPYPFEMATIKIEPKDMVLGNRNGTHTKDPTTELSALQMIAAHDQLEECGVIGASCVCTDHMHVFTILPYHGEGTLLQYVLEAGRLDEPMARHFFQQILKGLKTLETVGLCHRSLSLESTLLRGSTCNLADLGSAIRIPPKSGLLEPDLALGVGHPEYLAPEIVRGESFDGYAVDLWAAGVMLCGMLFGTNAPFAWASPDDRRFKEICLRGHLKDLSSKWEVENPLKRAKAEPVSDMAIDLLQSMLWSDPKARLKLDEVMEHPWVIGDNEVPTQPTDTHESE